MIFLAEALVQPRPEAVVVDRLQRVGVQRPSIDVGAVGRLRGESRQESFDDGAAGRIGGERCPLGRQRHQDVAVDVAADLLLAAVAGEVSAAPEVRAQPEAIVILMSWPHIARLEKRPRLEDAAVVRLPKASVEGADLLRSQVDRRHRRIAELRPEVTVLGPEGLDDGGRGPQPDVELLEGIVVDQVELHVLVAAALTGVGVGGAKQVQFRATVLGGGLRRGFRRRLSSGLRRRSLPESEGSQRQGGEPPEEPDHSY